ncbi:hypothetical protein KIW84_070160 [Lathyrus oleraceus]|uniref:Uncharacterized protein n=1 Tax=Pisum sativum TaxID=3888 RepID=A0A9D4ZU31_PEA|nr:hypothetical protein KIW84_070160 [Pisum sativum]
MNQKNEWETKYQYSRLGSDVLSSSETSTTDDIVLGHGHTMPQPLHPKENNWRFAEQGNMWDHSSRDDEPVPSDGMIVKYKPLEACDVEIGVDQKGPNKFHKWGKLWNKLGLIQRRKEDKLGEKECVSGDVVNKPIAESWQKLRRVVNGQRSESVSEKLIRSYSVSCRNHSRMPGFAHHVSDERFPPNYFSFLLLYMYYRRLRWKVSAEFFPFFVR